MDRNSKTPEQVCNEIEKFVKEIQDYDGTSGNVEKEWRVAQQSLLHLLSKYPLDIYRLSDELKRDVHTIVTAYLAWSFDACW